MRSTQRRCNNASGGREALGEGGLARAQTDVAEIFARLKGDVEGQLRGDGRDLNPGYDVSMARLENEVLQDVLAGLDRARAALEDVRRTVAESAPAEGSVEQLRRDYDRAIARQPRIDAGTASIIARLDRPGVVRIGRGG